MLCAAGTQCQDAAFLSTSMRAPRGMPALYPPHAERRLAILSALHRVASLYGYAAIDTPVCEPRAAFVRSLGDASDIVAHKEMYALDGTDLVLRPEGTAGVVRSLVHDPAGAALLKSSRGAELRLRYAGAMFRRERPQRGRLRQFTQFGVECIGSSDKHGTDAAASASSALTDAECIAMAAHALEAAGVRLADGAVRLAVNTLGDAPSRARYARALAAHLAPRRARLSSASRERLDRGTTAAVLRILDSKREEDRQVVEEGAPRLRDFLTDAALARFDRVCAALERLGVRGFAVDERLVRGLDYYAHTVFEFIAAAGDGATAEAGEADAASEVAGGGGGGGLGRSQGTVLAGGRYDSLVEAMGGPAGVGGIGWAAGIERIELLLEAQQQQEEERERAVTETRRVAVNCVYVAAVTMSAKATTAVTAADGDESNGGASGKRVTNDAIVMQAAECAAALRRGRAPADDRASNDAATATATMTTAASADDRDADRGIRTILPPARTQLRKHLRAATECGARLALIVGEDEMRSGALCTLKRMDTGAQWPIWTRDQRNCSSSLSCLSRMVHAVRQALRAPYE